MRLLRRRPVPMRRRLGAVSLAGLAIGASLGVVALTDRSSDGAASDARHSESGFVSRIGCRPSGPPSDTRWVLAESGALFAADWEVADVVLEWCNELVVQSGAATVTVKAGGRVIGANRPLLGDEARRRRLPDGTDVEVVQHRDQPTTAAWTSADAFILMAGDVPADQLLALVPGVRVEGRQVVVEGDLVERERRPPSDWMLAGAERSSITHEIDGQQVTVETVRRPVDAASVFGAGDPVDLGSIGAGWVSEERASGAAVLAFATADGLVQVKGSGEGGRDRLTSVARELVPVSDEAWRSLVASTRSHQPGEIHREVERNLLRDVVIYLGPLAVMAGAVWLLVRFVDRFRR